MRRTFTLLGVALALVGCDALDPSSWDRTRQSAEIIIANSPGGGSGATGFGAVLLGFGTSLPDPNAPSRRVRASRYAISGGAGGPYSVFGAFDESVLDAHSTTGLYVNAGTDARYTGCVAGLFCGAGSSVSFATTALWHQDASAPHSACVIVPSGNAVFDASAGTYREQVQVRCEPTASQIQPINVPVQQVGFGASATSLPVEHPLGAAIFGAPGDAMGDGALYRLDDYPINDFIRVTLEGAPVGAGIGRTMASVALADGTILLATGGRDRPDDPVVVVVTLDPAGGPAVLRACLRGNGSRFGSALAFGDFDGDAVPDLAIGAGVSEPDAAAPQRVDQPIALFAGSALASGRALGCEDPPSTTLAPARTLACTNDVNAGFLCAATTNDTYLGFGASLAAADVNGDGHDDLLVGAPFAMGHGTVVVMAGGTTFDAIGATDHAFLTYASIPGGANLGATVSTLPGVDRAEIVAAYWGAGHVGLFFCSGIHGDRPEDFANIGGVTHGCVLPPRAQADVDASVATPDASSDAGMDAGASDASSDDAGSDTGDIDSGDLDANDVDGNTDAG